MNWNLIRQLNMAFFLLHSFQATLAVDSDWSKHDATTPAITEGMLAAKFVSSRNELLHTRLWAQVNRALLYADNGEYAESFSVDNDSSPSRIGMSGETMQNGSDETVFGGQLELGLKSESSYAAEFNKERRDFEIDGRKIEVYLKSKQRGTLWLGQGDTASNGTAEQDLSGTYVISYSQVRFMGAGLAFYNQDYGETNAPVLKDVFNNFDGLHRDDRIRYDFPLWQNITLSASMTNGDRYDGALRYARIIQGNKIAAAASFADRGNGIKQLSGSCSLLLESGLSMTVAAGGQDLKGRDPSLLYAKLGLRKSLLSCGESRIAVDYALNREVERINDKAHSYAFVVNQVIDSICSELYVGVRSYTLNRPGENYHNLAVVMSGIRMKF